MALIYNREDPAKKRNGIRSGCPTRPGLRWKITIGRITALPKTSISKRPSASTSGYLDAEHADSYLPRMLSEVLEGKLHALGGRIGRQVFKLSMKEAIMSNLLAYDIDVDLDTLKKLRGRCVKEVRVTNGEIGFEDALLYQRGAE